VDLLPRSINIERNLVVADPVPGGIHVDPHVYVLGQLLHLAESQFWPQGPGRSPILGAEFRKGSANLVSPGIGVMWPFNSA